MKIVTFFAVLPFLISAGAQASVVNFSGSNVDMGTVQIGQSGTISNNSANTTVGPYTFADGGDIAALPSDESITFTYTFSNLTYGSLHSFGSYDYTKSGSTYTGNSSAYSGQPTVTAASTNGISTAPLTFASANINGGLTQGTTRITNTSSSIAQIETMFSGLFSSSGRLVSVTYSVSAVPLPASLPMFAAVLAGLFGFSQYRKRRSAI